MRPESGPGGRTHLCWAYHDPADFRQRAREFLIDGLKAGEQVWYIAAGSVRTLADDLAGLDGLPEALDSGAARVVGLDSMYQLDGVIDAETQLRTFDAATRRALATGYTGLRVATDCTPLATTPDQVAALAGFEHRLDHYMAGSPFSAMCGYQRDLDQRVLALLACLHPVGNIASAGFRLLGSPDAAAVLDGALDWSVADSFATALQQADPRPVAGRLVFDARGLRFLDHNSLLQLADHAALRQAELVLRTGWPGVRTLVRLLGVPGISVEDAA